MLNSPKKWYILTLCLAVLLVIAIPLEYGSFRFKTVVFPILWITLGVTGIKLISNKQNRYMVVKLIIAFGIYVLLTLYFLFTLTFCRTGESRVWYVHKENPSVNLICRSFECYMTSGPCTLYKSRKIIGKLRWTIKFSDNVVDTTKWQKVAK